MQDYLLKSERLVLYTLLLIVILLSSGCTGAPPDAVSPSMASPESESSTEVSAVATQESELGEPLVTSTIPEEFAGSWRAYSEAIFYDAGGSNWLDTPTTQRLELNTNGRWTFGDSSSTWRVAAIEVSDWEKWTIDSYGPTRKLVLDDWNQEGANGPIEEVEGRVDFVWVIYHVEPPTVTWPGTVMIKFGR